MDWIDQLALETQQALGRHATTTTAQRTAGKRYSRAELQQFDRELRGARKPSAHSVALNNKLKQSKRTASGLSREQLEQFNKELREGR